MAYKKYSLSKLYYANINGEISIIYEINNDYIELINVKDYKIIDRKLNDGFTIKKSFKEEINDKKINVCLISKDSKEKRELTLDEIINILKVITLLEKKSYDSLNNLCANMSNQICDLLGINISNPSSDLKIIDIEEVVVPATKALKFKNLLSNYIKISIILDGEVTITNNDYRIIRALNGCKIKKNEFENEFDITANINGEIKLNCQNVEQGFQKQNKNKYKKSLTNI